MTDPAVFMREALAEARKGLGLTAPNPAVGAVVVRKGEIVGRGWHKKAGAPHAEPMALRDAGVSASGADLYVTLEPCCTQGRTPPCTQAVLAAGIRRVFVGCTDPNPAHAGKAYALLRGAGVEVVEDVLKAECGHLVRAFAHVQRTGRPYVTLKLGCSLDGRVADRRGTSQWITGPASRARVQQLRREVDAVLVGTQTARKDNPSLMPRPARGRRPLRVVPDRRGALPLSLKLFNDTHAAKTLCLLGPEATSVREKRLADRGVACLRVAVGRAGLDWKRIFPLLSRRGVQHVLCEGGGKLAAALLRANLVNEIHWIVAPLALGATGVPALHASWTLANAPRFRPVRVESLGDDTWISLALEEG